MNIKSDSGPEIRAIIGDSNGKTIVVRLWKAFIRLLFCESQLGSKMDSLLNKSARLGIRASFVEALRFEEYEIIGRSWKLV